MKYLIIWASGLADEPSPELGDRSPLEVARTPALDEAARIGRIASVATLPTDLPASEEVALFSALGYDPHIHFTGEAALAAAELLPRLSKGQAAFIHNLATEADGQIVDHTGGRIRPQEADALLQSLAKELNDPSVEFSVGRGFTGITLTKLSVAPAPQCRPPETMWGQPIEKCMPQGEGAEKLENIISLSREVFAEHEINRVRTDLGENPANILWLWGPGRPHEIPSFQSQYGLQTTLFSSDPAARGLGKLTGLTVASVPEDNSDKAQPVIDALALSDAVILHVSDADHLSLEGDLQGCIAFIEAMDRNIVAPLLAHITQSEFTRLLFLPTHVASTSQRLRLRNPVPALLCGPGFAPVRARPFSERACSQAGVVVDHGYELMEYFMRT
jgi:2,3-bisphosphoglycerate-independent phosphoglycerate mutase